MIDDLYSANILRLAANLPRAGRLAAPDASAEKVAKLCGSRIVVDVVMADGKVADFAQEVRACALGQAAAGAVLGAHVIGATPEEIEMARAAFRAMLKTGGAPPTGRFSDLSMLEPVKDYPPRHASTLLAFEATVEACRLAQAKVQAQDQAKAAARTQPRRRGLTRERLLGEAIGVGMTFYERVIRTGHRAYKLTLSPWIGRNCRYLPTCSDYAAEALIQHGPLRGGYLAAGRLCRCHPWGGSGFDPVPSSASRGGKKDP